MPAPRARDHAGRELVPRTQETLALDERFVHAQGIETTAPPFTIRHARTFAAVLLVSSITTSMAKLCLELTRALAARLVNAPVSTASELLCFGVVGAVLISRRPDLPFGWILGLG